MSTMKYLELTEECKKFISDLISLEQQPVSENEIWVRIHHTHLYQSDKATLLDKAECLSDNHMACAQLLLRQAFPALSGLVSTLGHTSLCFFCSTEDVTKQSNYILYVDSACKVASNLSLRTDMHHSNLTIQFQ